MQIQSGTVANGFEVDNTWQLHKGPVGERLFTRSVTFESKYSKPPKIVIGLSGLDVAQAPNKRVQVTAKDITENGFVVEYKTWYDTVLYSVWANWLAYGD